MKTNILCIEDHPDNMMLIKRIFQSEKYNLMEARTGLQGLSIAESNNIDLILLDINLPDIDGYEVAHRLRANKNAALAHTPIIAVTANALKGDAQKALDAGCNTYIPKPIDIFELMETVESMVSKEARGNT